MRILSSIVFASAVAAGASSAFADSILYVDDSNGGLAKVDADTGSTTFIGNMGVVMTDIAMNSNGAMYGISFSNLYSINIITAATTNIGSFGSGINDLNALVFGSNGTLYSAGYNDTKLYTLNTLTGTATALTGSTGVDSAGDLAFNPDNSSNLYESDTNGALVKVSLGPPVSGTVIGSFNVSNGDDMYGMATGTDGVLYGLADSDIYSIKTSTGKATYLSDFSDPTHNFCEGSAYAYGATAPWPSAPVPEPATLGLMAMGGMLLLAKRRKKA